MDIALMLLVTAIALSIPRPRLRKKPAQKVEVIDQARLGWDVPTDVSAADVHELYREKPSKLLP